MNETSPFNPSIPFYLREVADALLEAFHFYEDPYLTPTRMKIIRGRTRK